MADSDPNAFDDLLAGNAAYAVNHRLAAPTGVAARGLAIVTCIDSRIDPLRVFGLVPGDAKILRNAGGRVTDDVVRSLSVSAAVLGVTRIAVVEHTDCKMASVDERGAAEAVERATGRSVGDAIFATITDQRATVAADVAVLQESPLIPDAVVVAGFLLDLQAGTLQQVGVVPPYGESGVTMA